MKKVLRIMIASVLAGLSVFSLTACGAKTDNAAYAIVHGHYLGRSVVTVDKDNVITDIEIDEMEMPYTWAKVSDGKIEGVEIADADTVTINTFTRPTEAKPNGDPVTVKYAKKVKIGNMTLQIDGGEVSYPNAGDYYYSVDTKLPLRMLAGIAGAELWNAMIDGEYSILKTDGSAYDIPFTAEADDTHDALKKGERWQKSKNGYWTVAEPALGWKGNMEKIKTFFVGKKLDEVKTVELDNKVWKVNGVSTGATATDFSDYMELIYYSYTKATI